jgi:hypothetical protein
MTTKTIEEILKEVPALKRYEGNPEAIRTVYAELNPKKDLSGLTDGEFVNGAEVLIVRVLNESYYIGCPTCFTKKDGMEEGVAFDCPSDRCKVQRVATKLPRWSILAGDETTKAILDFPPFGFKLTDGNALIGKVVAIKGNVTALRDQKVKGEVKSKTPVIMVRDLKVVSDIRDSVPETMAEQITKSTLAEAAKVPPAPLGEGPEGLPNPPVSPNTGMIPAPKLATLRTWMTAIGKPVAEDQVKMYVENNLKLAFGDVLPLLDKSHSDQENKTLYALKPQK